MKGHDGHERKNKKDNDRKMRGHERKHKGWVRRRISTVCFFFLKSMKNPTDRIIRQVLAGSLLEDVPCTVVTEVKSGAVCA